MLGPLVNAVVIFLAGIAGSFLIKGHINKRVGETVQVANGLIVVFIGIQGALATRRVLLFILSIVIGAVIGEVLDLDGRMNRFGGWLERKMKLGEGEKSGFGAAFIKATILFCTGSMAIVGGIQSGLGDPTFLFTKSIIDGSIALFFAASMGAGTAFSGVSVLVYEGLIAVLAALARGALTDDIIREMGAVGSLVIAAIGIDLSG
jgi:uncharacterized membrane protein YqgA involved in biofilm formation